MSRTLAILFTVNLYSAFSDVNHAADVRPVECASFPNGCTCTTRNASVGVTTEGEVRYDTIVVAITCNNIGLTEVPNFSNHTGVETIELQRNKIKKIHQKDFAKLIRLTNLDLSYNLIGDIENGSFSTTALKKLKLQYNFLTTLPVYFLNQFTMLNLLDLRHNSFTKIPSESLRRNLNIRNLYLSHNPIGSLASHAFAGEDSYSHLTDLILINCSIYSIDNGAFFGLQELQNLDLDHNHLKRLTRDMLKYLPSNLQLFTARYNRIERLDQDAFRDVKQIHSIYLDHNNICAIQEKTFKGLSSLDKLSLESNKILTISKKAFMGSLIHSLYLSWNRIDALHPDTFRKQHELLEVYLTGNQLVTVNPRLFRFMRYLQVLDLGYNQIIEVPKLQSESLLYYHLEGNNLTYADYDAFAGVPNVRILILSYNHMELHNDSLRPLGHLRELIIQGNHLLTHLPSLENNPLLRAIDIDYCRIVELPEDLCTACPRLQILSLHSNSLTYIPKLEGCVNLDGLSFSHNEIESLHNLPFSGLHYLQLLELDNNRITSLPLKVFSDLYSLTHLYLEHNSISKIPLNTFNATVNMQFLYLSHMGIQRISEHVFPENMSNLLVLSFSHNEIESLHNLSFSGLHHLQLLELDNNRITSLPLKVFSDLYSLTHLYLEHNSISKIPLNTFNATVNMQFLNMSSNPVWELQDGVFHDMQYVNELYLSHMGIQRISEHAFPENMSNLLVLDLSDNDFDHLPIPKYGWPELRFIYLNDVPLLYQAPGPSDCPKLQGATFTYAYHCCAFESLLLPDWHKASSPYVGPVIIRPEPVVIEDSEEVTPAPDTKTTNISYVCEFFKLLNITGPCPTDEMAEPSFYPPQINITVTEIEIVRSLDVAQIPSTNSFTCYPKADPMAPCEHLLGSWALRILIWVVFLLVLFSNGLVLTMIVASLKPFQRYRLKDTKVSRLYISQLAAADIGISIYLGFLIVMDLKTLDKQEFYQKVLSWQYGAGCSTAGFIAILSLELLVYMLVVIMLECIYTYKYTRIATKMYKYRATLILLFGWVFAGVFALLPLLDVNSYSSVAICLPFDVISTKGRFYIAVLMGTNLLAFAIILICSFYLCCRLGKITIYNSKIFRVMFVLTVIVFMCWAPSIIFSLAALSKHAMIDTSTAKWFVLLVLPISACINPFQYGPLTVKVRHYIEKICYCAKRISPQCSTKGIEAQQNSIILNECDCQTTLEQNSPNTVSSNVPLLDRHASLPELKSDGSLPPISLSNSMPELAISGKMMIKTKATKGTVKVQATDKQSETNDNEQVEKKNLCATIILDKPDSSMIHHSTDESSGTDSPRLNIGTAYSVQETNEDLQNITSLSDTAAGTFNNDPNMINVLGSKLNSPPLVEETEV